MYLPRDSISHLYLQLIRTHHALSSPLLILTALEPDAVCACRILTALLKRDYISHKIHPISGYGDLERAGEALVRPMRIQDGGNGGVVVCLGVGGLIGLPDYLGLNSEDEDQMGGVEVWVIDARRPWNLENVFGGHPTRPILGEVDGNARIRTYGVDNGRILRNYKPGKGGIIVFDDGDIEEELTAEKDAYLALEQMPEVDEDEDGGEEGEESEEESEDELARSSEDRQTSSRKRKSWSNREYEDGTEDDEPPRQRRRSNSNSSIPSTRSTSPPQRRSPKLPSTRTLRKRLLRLRRSHEQVLRSYYSLGTSYSEPISSLMYSLASELGREDNDLLWLAIVGVSSLEISGHTPHGVGLAPPSSRIGGSAGWGGVRGERIRSILRDEVRRLNPPDLKESPSSRYFDFIPTTAKSSRDTSIRLSPEPRFYLIRHWSLYESMLHSPFLASRLHLWTDSGVKKLSKLFAKMGISIEQGKQEYTHMDMELKRILHSNLLKYAAHYGLEGVVPPATSASYTYNPSDLEGWSFVRSWGWKGCLSATDVAIIIGSILDVGVSPSSTVKSRDLSQSSQLALETNSSLPDMQSLIDRFYAAFDALSPPSSTNTSAPLTLLLSSIPLAQHLARAILRTGTALLQKGRIRSLSTFRMGVVKDGPDVQLFSNPGALVKLALWVGEAVRVQEGKTQDATKKGTALVLASLVEDRGVYIVVGLGGGAGAPAQTSKNKEQTAAQKKKVEEKKKRKEAREARRQEREERRKVAEDNGEEVESETESEESESESEDEGIDAELEQQVKKRGYGTNRFGIAFEAVAAEVGARVRIDGFEHCVVEVRKEDLSGFLEGLSGRAVVG